MFRKFIILVLALCPVLAHATSWYVSKGAAGTNAGTSWTNAWNELNQINYSSVACGDTIWVAGGTYTTELVTNKTCTAGNVLTIQRVLKSDVVPVAAAGWSATFDSTVNCTGECIDAEGAFITVSGRFGSGGSATGYGWVITTPVGGGNMTRGALSGNLTSFTYYGIAGVGPACAPAGNCTTAAYGFNVAPSSNIVNGLVIDHCLAYNMSELIRESNWENSIVQHSVLHDDVPDGVDHEDVMYNFTDASGGHNTIRWNTIYNSPNDGIFFEFGGAKNLNIYRNVFYASQFGFMTTKAPGAYGPINLVYNTFYSSTGACSSNCAFISDNSSTMTGVVNEGNVYGWISNSIAGNTGETSDYNAYNNTTYSGFASPNAGETHSFSYNDSTQNPFVSTSTGNFHLASNSTVLHAVGPNLGAPFNVDMDGAVAPVTGNWDIGAYQFSTPIGPQTFATGTVQVATPTRFGGNMGVITYYSSGEITKNMALALNAGFEPGLAQQIFAVAPLSSTTQFNGTNQFELGAGQGGQDGYNIWAGATIRIQTSQTSGNAGYTGTVVSNTGSVQATTCTSTGGTPSTITCTTDVNPITAGLAVGQTVNWEFPSGGTGYIGTFGCCVLTAVSSTQVSWSQATAATGTATGGFIGNNLAKTYTITPAAPNPIATGDVVVFTRTQVPTPQAQWAAGFGNIGLNISGGGTYFPATAPTYTLCATCGQQSFGTTVTTTGDAAGPIIYMDNGGTPDRFTNLNGTYAYSYKALLLSGSLPKINTSIGRVGQTQCAGTSTAISSSWALISGTCTFAETSPVSNTNLSMSAQSVYNGAANTILIDNFSFQKTSPVDATNTSVYRDEWVQMVRDHCAVTIPGARCPIRHWMTQNAETFSSWTQSNFMAPQAGLTLANGDGPARLYEYLQFVEMLGNADPYIEIPITFTPSDSALLVEFLIGSSSTTGGAVRAALGHTAPYGFTHIYLSYANEAWNTSFTYQNLPNRTGEPNCSIPSTNPKIYQDYGVNAGLIFAAMRADASYNSSIIQLGFDAQTANTSSIACSLQDSGPDYIEVNDYHVASMADASTDAAIWTSTFVEPYLRVTSSNDPSKFEPNVTTLLSYSYCGASKTAQCLVNVYETGNGTSGTCGAGAPACTGSGGTPPVQLTQTQADTITSGGGSGIPEVLAHLLNMQHFGLGPQVLFALNEYVNSSIGNVFKQHLWGNIVDAGGAGSAFNNQTYMSRPVENGAQVSNRAIIGSMFSCPIASTPTFNWAGDLYNGSINSNYTGTDGTPAVPNVPLVYSFCFKNGTKRGYVFISIDQNLTYNLPFSGTDSPIGTTLVAQWKPATISQACEAPGTTANNAVTACNITNSVQVSPASITLPPFSVISLSFDTATSGVAPPTITGGVVSTDGVKFQ